MNLAAPFSGHPYLTKHLIAYIGNKRALLGFLREVFETLPLGRGRRVFLDPFAGSGAVSRLARLLGYRVLAGDQEFYAYVLNAAHLGVQRREAAGLFQEQGGLERLLDRLNSLPPPREEERYIARHYAPRDTERADYRRERLFYSRENALRIDAVRSALEKLYPGFALEGPGKKEKLLLLASLLYQCATHTNTSGVFKACHKGFGGHNRDALGRILSPVRLEAPVLADGPPAEAFCLEAEEFARSHPGDLCYLDPPYNQHQYGSNYHLLNTIALWDKPPVDEALRPDGRLRSKAGIRRDWVRTRSPYCYRDRAAGALEGLLGAIDARFLCLSYNTEGIIPFEHLVELLAAQGELRLYGNDYVKYRGGKQSISRQVHNLELLLVVDRRAPGRGGARAQMEGLLLRRRTVLLFRRSFYPQRVRAAFRAPQDAILFETQAGDALRLEMPGHYRFLEGQEGFLGSLSAEELGRFQALLAPCECSNRKEEIGILVELLRGPLAEPRLRLYRKRILWLLKKFAFRKYRQEFMLTLEGLRLLAAEEPAVFGALEEELPRLERLAQARFQG